MNCQILPDGLKQSTASILYESSVPNPADIKFYESPPVWLNYEVYNIFVEVLAPESDKNYNAGNFGVTLEMKNERNQTVSLHTLGILRFKSPLIRLTEAVIFSLPVLFDIMSEDQTITLQIGHDIDFSAVKPTWLKLIIDDEHFDFSRVDVHFDVKLSGIRYYMYYWFYSFALLVLFASDIAIMITAAIVYYFWNRKEMYKELMKDYASQRVGSLLKFGSLHKGESEIPQRTNPTRSASRTRLFGKIKRLQQRDRTEMSTVSTARSTTGSEYISTIRSHLESDAETYRSIVRSQENTQREQHSKILEDDREAEQAFKDAAKKLKDSTTELNELLLQELEPWTSTPSRDSSTGRQRPGIENPDKLYSAL
eukprot:CAMPEP_0114998140 /NCGR_PEP_ID=MMETSP0216-20121206/15321_1 /TAXON_ID=223996 /ORGANISM="Protocruzia adherens, Strain Boccale" /LENGTH=367 /DNA_ID=CAMNT_0002362663 /DNA_START=395 /DNA_END=1495 /DNA_ORIENTATION=-